MSVLPGWAFPKSPTQRRQVSHGLNLVLELKHPLKLPLMLWDIVLAQNKIKRALETLSFVHFARFIPSWDGRALMVTTEFDGPLEPYVLDFVIALGDVFDTLLSYVKEPPRKLPVREHPEEFIRWVHEWNRVPFVAPRSEATLFPVGFDYPVYSAYPEKTVVDIIGPRRLLSPEVDRPAAAVDPTDVQGNILRGYRAKHGRYLFFRVTDAVAARRWLATDLPDATKPWAGIADATDWGAVKPNTLTQVAFTYSGLQTLLPAARQTELAPFPDAFKQGAAARAYDNFDRGTSAPETWLFGQEGLRIHVVLFVYTPHDPAPPAFAAAVQALEGLSGAGLSHLLTQSGVANGGKEWFGFADGLSNPGISGQCPGSEPTLQPLASPGEFLLHPDYKSIYGGRSIGEMPRALASNGTFGVLRLMEQDINLFEQETQDEATRLGLDVDRLRAKLVGRWANGAPLSLYPDNPPTASELEAGPVNAFDYSPSWEFPDVTDDHAGALCPVAAHIRRANPRTARVAGQAHSRRLLRRGMPSTWAASDGTPRHGLMGLFMGANIEQQFEFIQREWLHGSIAASGIRGTTDAISGIRTEKTDFPFIEPHPVCSYAPPQRLVARFSPWVRTRGCLYLFFPGIAALKSINRSSASPAADASTQEVQAEQAEGILNVVRQAVENVSTAIDQASTGSSVVQAVLSDLGASPLLGDLSELRALQNEPALQPLLNFGWREMVQDLLDRNLDSHWFRDFLYAIAPSHDDAQRPPNVPMAELDLTDPRLRADPFAALKRLRDSGQTLVWVREQEAVWVLSDAGCRELFTKNAGFLQTPPKAPPDGIKALPGGIVTIDDPRHGPVKAAYMQAFTAALQSLEDEGFIEQVVRETVKGLVDQVHLRHFDYMSQFAHPVARRVIWRFIGIDDPAEQRACDALADRLVQHYGKTAGGTGVQRLIAADAGLRLAARLAGPLARACLPLNNTYDGTLIGELARRTSLHAGSPADPELNFIETLLTLVQTVLASQSPHFLLGSAALHLMKPDPRPEKGGAIPWVGLASLSQADLKAALVLALNEVRRCEPPLALVERYASGTESILGVTLPRGCAVFAMVASANRDPQKYPAAPEDFHVDRQEAKDHLSLGGGIHKCAGEALQRLLVPAALGALIKAMPGLRLSNPAAQPAWHATIYFRVLQALSVTRCPPPPPVSVAARVHGDPQVPIS